MEKCSYYIFFYALLLMSEKYRKDGNVASYLGGIQFESWLGHWLRFLVVFLSPLGHYYTEIC